MSLLTRTAHFSSPFGEAVLLYTMTGRETLGRLYSYEVDLLSRDDSLDLSELLGQMCAIVMEHTDGTVRQLTGFATDFALVGEHNNFARYRTTLRPFLWFLGQNRGCRVFQRKSVPDIAQELCKDAGFSDIELSLHGQYDPWEFLVQYRESDLNFISRMLEHEGIYYYFRHEDGKHVLVLADNAAAHHTKRHFASVPYYTPTLAAQSQSDHLDTWTVSRQIRQGRVQLRDFNFEYPLAFSGEKQGQFPENGGGFELYDYPAQINEKTNDKAKKATDLRAEIRLEEHQADYEVVRGGGPLRGVGAGDKFALTDFPREDQNKEYLIVACSYDLRVAEYESNVRGNVKGEEDDLFRFELSAIDAKRPYRSPRITPKPIVEGPQTATVAGDAAKEITTDEYGRVPIQFHWDREGKRDQNSSCMVRVSQSWAGSGFGSSHIPRYGQEVIVHFLEGDPDRPIITGRVYNADNPAPYPKNPTQSGFKSHSTPGASAENFNEIRFDDKKGEEELHIQAEKDMSTLVKHDQTTTIGRNSTVNIQGDQFIHIHGNLSMTVDGVTDKDNPDKSKPIKSSMAVTGAHDMKATDSVTISAPNKITLSVPGSTITITPGGISISAGGGASISLGDAINQAAKGGGKATINDKVLISGQGGAKLQLDAEANIEAKAGAKLKMDGNILATANGSGKALVDKGGVTLEGDGITAKGNNEATVAAGGSSLKLTTGSAEVNSASTSVKGGTMVSISGPLVKIN